MDLGGQVVKAEDKSPVEVSLPGERIEVDIRLLLVAFQASNPTGCREKKWLKS